MKKIIQKQEFFDVEVGGAEYILYRADNVDVGQVRHVFSPSYLKAQQMLVGSAGAGRGNAYFFKTRDCDFVLRHYCRGGLVRHLCKDRYVWTGLEKTRAWREWHLLAQLKQRGLPVPIPWAARVERRGLWYRADLITERLLNVLTLSALALQPVEDERWQAVGACVRRFHDVGVYHADLNAHNILLAEDGQVYLIDFDRGELRKPVKAWQQANLDRLHRSLVKLSANGTIKEFDERVWQVLLEGYGVSQ